jgi:hypothetical protein
MFNVTFDKYSLFVRLKDLDELKRAYIKIIRQK